MKTRVKGEVDGAFTISFDNEKGDQFFILFKENRFPKDRKELPNTTVDFIQSKGHSYEEQAKMLFTMYRSGDSHNKAVLGKFIAMAVNDAMMLRAVEQQKYEKQKYADEHNGNITKEANNLSTKDD